MILVGGILVDYWLKTQQKKKILSTHRCKRELILTISFLPFSVYFAFFFFFFFFCTNFFQKFVKQQTKKSNRYFHWFFFSCLIYFLLLFSHFVASDLCVCVPIFCYLSVILQTIRFFSVIFWYEEKKKRTKTWELKTQIMVYQ